MKVWLPMALSPLPDDHLLKGTTINSFIFFLLEIFIYVYSSICICHSLRHFIHLFIHPKNIFLRTYSVSGRILNPGDIVMNKTEKVSPLRAFRI